MVSAYIECIFFASIIQDPGMAFYITSLFECAKVLTILVTRRIIIADSKGMTTPLIVLGWFVKIALVIISLTASIGYLANSLDRPNLKSVQAADKERNEKLYQEKYSHLENQKKTDYDQKISEIKNRYKKRYDNLAKYYEPKIQQEERARDFEFTRKINGVRKGERYREHVRKLNELNQEYKIEKDKLSSDESQEILGYTKRNDSVYQQKLDDLEKTHEAKLDQIVKSTYSKDSRVENKIVTSFLSTLKAAMDVDMEALTFSFLFSLIISFTLEGLIYIIFNNIAIFYSIIHSGEEEEAEKSNAIKDFLNKNIHNAADFISRKTNTGEAGHEFN